MRKHNELSKLCYNLIGSIKHEIGVEILDSLEFAREVVNAVEDKKAEQIVLLDLRPDAIIADFFVICNGGSDRQIKAIADGVRESMKDKYQRLPVAVEGESTSGWMLMDYGDVIVHIFDEDSRAYYDLEGFWTQAQVLLSIQ